MSNKIQLALSFYRFRIICFRYVLDEIVAKMTAEQGIVRAGSGHERAFSLNIGTDWKDQQKSFLLYAEGFPL
ncbi:MAG TPA: hypothetical protein VGI43_16710 [Mucilaginibacter sp.]|jgi:hypothetical protein